MNVSSPFLTTYDPPGTSEGTLDPLGLYQIADQLAVALVPAVRERMQRVRFLTAMAVGALVTEGIEEDERQRDAAPYLVWEWLIVSALMGHGADDETMWGIPGTMVTRRALRGSGRLDAVQYLKTPRIFGFHGVYKRLALQMGLLDVHLAPGPNAEALVDVWARGQGLGGLSAVRPQLGAWSAAVRRCLAEKPPQAAPRWDTESWHAVAAAFAPGTTPPVERAFMKRLLLDGGERRVGALRDIWALQPEFSGDTLREEDLHARLGDRVPAYVPLLRAIASYEAFARAVHDAFELLRAEAARVDAQSYVATRIAGDADFQASVTGLHDRFAAAHRDLGEAGPSGAGLQGLFTARYGALAEPLSAAGCATTLCELHEAVQRAKSLDGKRPWFDRLGPDRIFIRHAYRVPRPIPQPGRYVHYYRTWPIRRFYEDLA